jgi:hypothetical protein
MPSWRAYVGQPAKPSVVLEAGTPRVILAVAMFGLRVLRLKQCNSEQEQLQREGSRRGALAHIAEARCKPSAASDAM